MSRAIGFLGAALSAGTETVKPFVEMSMKQKMQEARDRLLHGQAMERQTNQQNWAASQADLDRGLTASEGAANRGARATEGNLNRASAKELQELRFDQEENMADIDTGNRLNLMEYGSELRKDEMTHQAGLEKDLAVLKAVYGSARSGDTSWKVLLETMQEQLKSNPQLFKNEQWQGYLKSVIDRVPKNDPTYESFVSIHTGTYSESYGNNQRGPGGPASLGPANQNPYLSSMTLYDE